MLVRKLMLSNGRQLATGLTLGLSLVLSGCDSGPSADEFVAKARTALAAGDMNSGVIELKNALQKDADNADARWLLGDLHLRLGQGAPAAKELKRAKALGMDSEELTLALLRSELLQGKFKEVLSAVPTTKATQKPELLSIIKGQAHLGLAQPEEARAAFTAALTLNPNNIEAQRGLARISFGERNFSDAQTQLSAVLSKHGDDAQTLMLKGEADIAAGQMEAALESFTRAAAATPDAPGPQIGRVRALLGLDRAEEALQIIETLHAASPNNPTINYFRGIAARVAGNTDIAYEALREVLRLQPNHTQSLLVMGSIQYEREEFRQAEDSIGKFLSAVPSHVPARKLLGAVHMRLGQPEQAVATLEPALEAAGEDAQFMAMLGTAYMSSNNSAKGMTLLEKAVELDPKQAATRTQLALSQFASGSGDAGLASLKGAVEVDPNFTQAEVLIILAHLRSKDWEAAIAAADALATKRPNEPLAFNLLGTAHAGKGDKDTGRKFFQQALTVSPDFTEAALNLAALDAQNGDMELARDQYQKILDKDPSSERAAIALAEILGREGKRAEAVALMEATRKNSPTGMQVRVGLMAEYLRTGQAAKALAVAEEAERLRPSDPGIQLGLAQAHALSNDLGPAQRILNELKETQPKSADVRFQLGLVLMRANDLLLAKASLNEALERNPTHYGAELALGDIAVNQERFDVALAIASKLLERSPKDPGGLVLRGDAHMRAKNFQGAVEAYTAGLELARSPQLILKLYGATLAIKKPGEARALLVDWLKENPDDPQIRLALASVDQSKGEGNVAAANYEKVLTAAPNNVVALNNLAWIYFDSGDERALGLAERAYELAPRVPAVADTYGWFLLQVGKLEQGLAILERAAKADPQQMEIQYHLAVALVEAGVRKRARKILTKVIASSFEFSARAEAERLHKAL